MALTLLTRRDPFTDFDAMIRHAFPAAAQNATGPRTVRSRADGAKPVFVPAADIVRDGDDAVISLDAPGLDFERDITVELDGTTLVIAGERRNGTSDTSEAVDNDGDGSDTATAPDKRILRSEIRYGAFRRTFTLPEQVTAESLSATYDAGVLDVRVAGAYVTTAPQKIAVTAGNGSVATIPATGIGIEG